jgi:hypothetical protein
MKNIFRTYRNSKEYGITEDGGELQWVHGCSGDLHADSLSIVYRDQRDYAKPLTIIVRGPCDGSCQPLGGFLCDVPDIALKLPRKVDHDLENPEFDDRVEYSDDFKDEW